MSSMAALDVLSPGVPASASLTGAACRISSKRVSAHKLPGTWEELLGWELAQRTRQSLCQPICPAPSSRALMAGGDLQHVEITSAAACALSSDTLSLPMGTGTGGRLPLGVRLLGVFALSSEASWEL